MFASNRLLGRIAREGKSAEEVTWAPGEALVGLGDGETVGRIWQDLVRGEPPYTIDKCGRFGKHLLNAKHLVLSIGVPGMGHYHGPKRSIDR